MVYAHKYLPLPVGGGGGQQEGQTKQLSALEMNKGKFEMKRGIDKNKNICIYIYLHQGIYVCMYININMHLSANKPSE